MTSTDPAHQIVVARDEPEIGLVRGLFRQYVDEWSAMIGEALRIQKFDDEIAGLPGRYASPSGCLLLAMEGETPAGCVAMRDLGDGVCEMKRLYVAPTRRGRGLGGRLIAEIVRKARAAGHRRMMLDTHPEMAGARALYQDHGFVETGRYADHSPQGAIFLAKSLDIEGVNTKGSDHDER